MATFLGLLADQGSMWTSTPSHSGSDPLGYVDIPIASSVPAGSFVAIAYRIGAPGSAPTSASDANGNEWNSSLDPDENLHFSKLVWNERIGILSTRLTASLASSVRVRFAGSPPTQFSAWVLGYSSDAVGSGGFVWTVMSELYFDLLLADSTPDIVWAPNGDVAVGIAIARREADAIFSAWRDGSWATVASHTSTGATSGGHVVVGHRLGSVSASGEHFGAVYATPVRREVFRGAVGMEVAS